MISSNPFQSTPSARRATQRVVNFVELFEFQSTPSARRATCRIRQREDWATNFNPRPPRGGRPARKTKSINLSQFQSTPSARRATISLPPDFTKCFYFNPRPPRGGRLHAVPCAGCFVVISIHALREEGDARLSVTKRCRFLFQSTPSARRATPLIRLYNPDNKISIHALREEGDLAVVKLAGFFVISIHALREEGDTIENRLKYAIQDFNPRPPRGGRLLLLIWIDGIWLFQSTPSARRATKTDARRHPAVRISIHALREEGDGCQQKPTKCQAYFNPRPPRGGRLSGRVYSLARFSISIHALREEGDYGGTGNNSWGKSFQSTPSARRATNWRRVLSKA